MKLNRGKIGRAESVSLAALSLFTCGVFAIDPKTAYAEGNLTYLSIPVSVLLSLCVVLVCSAAIERKGCGDLFGLFRSTLGKAPAFLLTLALSASFIFAAAKPLSSFVEVLHRLVYDGVSYGSLFVFIVPAVVFAAWKGFESTGRLALIFSALILVSVVAAVLSAAPEFDAGRLFPFPGTVALGFTKDALSGMLFTLPPLAALAVNAVGLGGAGQMRRSALLGALFASLGIGLTQLAIALIYPPRVLSGLLMPLYRINFLSLSQSYALRLDKLFIMIWLSGCVICAAYLVYSASLLLTLSFGGKDVTPYVLTVSLTLTLVSSLGFVGDYGFAEKVMKTAESFGFLFAAVPLFAASVLGFFGKGMKKT